MPLSRRAFIGSAVAAGLPVSISRAQKQPEAPTALPARAVTQGPKHHFFGYYDKCPWDKTGRYLLANEIDFCDRQPKSGEALTVGMVDLQDKDKFIPLDQTTAWCWQQG